MSNQDFSSLLNTRRRLLTALAAAGATGFVTPARAQEAASAYPSKPIRIVVGFAPGGATDIVARAVAQKLQDALGQSVVVENKPGGGSNIGAEIVARAEPDGYTLLLGTIANATNMSIYKNLKYDTLRDFAPISQLMSAPSVLVVSPNFPANDVKGLIELARARPGTLTYASSGAGGSPHLAGAMLELRAGVQMVHVPYKGAAPALTDVVAGNVNLGFKTALSALPSMQTGKLKALAVAANKRLEQLPNVPTMAEAGFPDFEVSSWNGLLAPSKTPPAIIAKLHAELVKIVAMPDIRERFSAQAADPVGSSPEQFRAYMEAEIKRWGEVAKAASISLN
jgi:tripartite-type tricarboxylate transporter receptor subunit TctC